jgi:twitching motility protein PilT
MTIQDVIYAGREAGASDIHLSEGLPMEFRINGALGPAPVQTSGPDETRALILSMLDDVQREIFDSGKDSDFAIQTEDGKRQRVNVFRQQKSLAATVRLLNDHIPSLAELNLPPVLQNLADQPRGLVLVTGPTGSGKSTTLAAMVDHINKTRSEHIITIEDPIEYKYETGQSLIHQREVGVDTQSFASSLRSALREDPDVILVGEMRDYETISAAVTAAETGHLVLSTLHTTGAAQTVDRIVDACPGEVQNQMRTQLSQILKGIITQCLIPRADVRGRIAATEILIGSDAALNLIRENKTFQLNSTMQSGAALGMHTLNGDLTKLVRNGMISREYAMQYSNDRRDLQQYLM